MGQYVSCENMDLRIQLSFLWKLLTPLQLRLNSCCNTFHLRYPGAASHRDIICISCWESFNNICNHPFWVLYCFIIWAGLKRTNISIKKSFIIFENIRKCVPLCTGRSCLSRWLTQHNLFMKTYLGLTSVIHGFFFKHSDPF